MVGEKARSVYRKKRKGKPFSGTKRQQGESEEPASVGDEISSPTASTSRDDNHLSDSDSEKAIGSSRKKMKFTKEELSFDSSDDEISFYTEETEGYRLSDMKNLSTAVSNVHVCEEGEKFSEINAILFNFLVTFFHILSAPSSKVKIFLPLFKYTDLSITSWLSCEEVFLYKCLFCI